MNPNKHIVDRLKILYPAGCRVELDKMDDRQAPPEGTCGTVLHVDSIGTIHVCWDTGSSLGVVFGQDLCHRIDRRR